MKYQNHLTWLRTLSQRTAAIAAVVGIVGASGMTSLAASVTGTVYLDADQNGVRSYQDTGIAGVLVSDGLSVTTTDSEGKYALQTCDERVTVFVTVPAGYGVAEKFWRTVTIRGDRARADFGLRIDPASEKSEYTYALMADYQNDPGDAGELLTPILRHIMSDEESPGFIVHLGDIMASPEGVSSTMAMRDHKSYRAALTGYHLGGDEAPVYSLMGNHDKLYSEAVWGPAFPGFEDRLYREYLGPSYYSWDYGQIHHVALSDFSAPKGQLISAIPERQLKWLENDLAAQPDGKPIVVYAHGHLDSLANEADFAKVIKGRNVLVSFNGHAHANWGKRLAKSGIWSISLTGVHWSQDWMPRGYYVVRVKGAELEYEFKTFEGWGPLYCSFPIAGATVYGMTDMRVHLNHPVQVPKPDAKPPLKGGTIKYSIDGGEWVQMKPYASDMAGSLFRQTWISSANFTPGHHKVTFRAQSPYGDESSEMTQDIICSASAPVRWSFNGSGTGDAAMSKPAICDKGVLIGTKKGAVCLLSQKDGQTIWSSPASGTTISLAPVASGDKVWALDAKNRLCAYDIATGEVRLSVDASIPSQYSGGFAVTDKAVVCGTWNYAAQKALLTAYSVDTGAILWKKDYPYGHIPALTTDGTLVFFQTSTACVAVDSTSGETAWQFASDRPYMIGEVFVEGDVVFATECFARVYVLEKSTGELIATYDANEAPRPASDRVDTLYVTGGPNGLTAFFGPTGTAVWHARRPLEKVAPLIVGSSVVAMGADRTLYTFDAETGAIRDALQVGQLLSGTSPVTDGATIYVTISGKGLIAIDAH